jgi:hypothetical protein
MATTDKEIMHKSASAVAVADAPKTEGKDRTAQQEIQDEVAKTFKVERVPAPASAKAAGDKDRAASKADDKPSSVVTVTIHSDDELFNEILIAIGQKLNGVGRGEQAMKLHEMLLKV